MAKAKPKPKPKAKPAAKGGTSPPPKPSKAPKRRELTKTLVLQILLAKLEASKTCDWYALSQRLGDDGGGKEITGTELHELYHNVVLPGLKDGRALWVDDGGDVHFPDREDEVAMATPLRVSPRTRDNGRERVGAPDPLEEYNDFESEELSSGGDDDEEGDLATDDDPMDAASPSPSDASWHSHAASTPSRKRKSPADKPKQRKRMQTKRESGAATARNKKRTDGRRKSFGAWSDDN